MPSNNSYTGYLGWLTLTQINAVTGQPTGVVVPNVPSDPNYVAPVFDDVTCSPVVLPTITPTPTATLPLTGPGALKFDGVLHYVNIPYQTNLDPCESAKDFTIFVDYYQTGGVKVINNQKNVAVENSFGFYINSYAGVVQVGIYNVGLGGDEVFSAAYSMWNTRIKLTITLDVTAAIWKMYINGSLVATRPYTFINQQPADGWQFGGYFRDISSEAYQGYIYDFQYFNRALSLSEIVNLEAGNVISTGKLAHFKLDQNTGYVAVDSVYGNNGTLFNYTLSQTSLGINNHWVKEDLTPKT